MNINKAIQLAFEHYQQGNLHKAEYIYREILKVQPDNVVAHCNLGIVLREKGQLDEAITCYQKAVKLNPNLADVYCNLGSAFQEKGQLDETITCYQKAIKINPNLADVHCNLGRALQEKGQLDEAITCYQKAIKLNPNFYMAYNNLGGVLQDRGQLNEAEIYFRRVLQITPDNCKAYSNLLLNMNYNSRHNPQDIFSEHLLFAKKFAEPLSSAISPHTNEREPNRRLRIGYVSHDFRRHPVAYFIEPVLVAHSREHFEVFCYSDVSVPDDVTRRIQGYSDHWQSIVGMSDERVAESIKKDNIDILIDLAGHTANNRMLLFARKPAPIQVSWIGYLATTGLSTIDYKIVDNYTDPIGKTEQFYTEKLIRLPENSLCYLPDRDSPEVEPLPALSTGHITFGSFNNFAKVTPEVFTLWARVLNELPDSRLILKGNSFSDKTTSQRAINMFTERGISAERITLLLWDPSPKHLESYNQVDIGLDTFPFNGATTTCEALWMGVPVITLTGTAYHSRAGISLLANVGLLELIAKTHDEYIGIAINLASDIEKLQLLRKSLRDRMSHSPLTDAKRFTANLEMCYRKMWENWCNSV
jgi:predicted O-linked N-acetylglucosamine transferase (SPINDLY family)